MSKSSVIEMDIPLLDISSNFSAQVHTITIAHRPADGVLFPEVFYVF
jgi:hypothetical protein